MEFTKDIYFNDNLTNGKSATITYSGFLFRNGSEYVNLVFGFGENWDYTTTLPMKKTENGFTAEVEIKDYNVFNFCFSDEHNNWDNNNSCNYISPILPKINEFAEDSINYGTDYSSSIDNIIEDILGNTVQNSIANDKDFDSVDKILESISEESLPEIEELFTELFSEEFDHPEPINEIKEEVPSIPEDSNAEIIQLFNELFSEEFDHPEPVNEIKEEVPSIAEETNAELIRIFNELFESNTVTDTANVEETIIEEKEEQLNTNSFNLDGLVSDLLDPVISKPAVDLDNEISLFDDIKEHEDDEETSLTVIDSTDLLVSSRKLSAFYKFKKRIKIACYKLFVKVPKQLAKQLGFGQD